MRKEMAEETTVEIQVNGKDREVPRGLSVHALLEHFELNPALVVVERNREILDRPLYQETLVRDGDSFELVHFVGGG